MIYMTYTINNMNTLDLINYFGPRLLVATICGLIIGVEREVKGKVAGLRSNLLICVGVTLFTSASFYYSQLDKNVDPTRMIGQIITGIGFLGGGAIYKSEDKIIGFTTAAFIWCMASIGILIGTGLYTISIITTIGLVVVSLILERVERYMKLKKDRERQQ